MMLARLQEESYTKHGLDLADLGAPPSQLTRPQALGQGRPSPENDNADTVAAGTSKLKKWESW